MENNELNSVDQELAAMRKKFEDAVVETVLSESGAQTYIIKDGLDLKEYASLAKIILEANGDIAHDFNGRVVNESKTDHADFEYKSRWPLDGLAEIEI